jgi:hypothetical protein
VDFIWSRLTNSNGGGGVDLTLAGNQAVIEQSTGPPAHGDYNVHHYVSSPRHSSYPYTLLITDERFYSPAQAVNEVLGRGLVLRRSGAKGD